MRFAHCSEIWLYLPHLPENMEKAPKIGNMQHFRTATSSRLFVNMWLNNCERKLPFATVSYKVIACYKCSSEFTFEQEKQFFVNSFFSFHSMIK